MISLAIADYAFSPSSLRIAVGDSVRASNPGPSAHTWTARGGAFDSGNLESGGSFTFRFRTAGVYSFVCSYHSQMTGTLTVQ